MSRPPATKATAETAELPSISGTAASIAKAEVVAARRRRTYFMEIFDRNTSRATDL
jgi:hypothetical protein